MKVSRERYQHGSVRKVPRSQGLAWEFRFYQTIDGARKLKVQTFDSPVFFSPDAQGLEGATAARPPRI